ncbi:MAG TPA: PP2C family protein-serine/threonine phosphatase [Streptosporangiaceae bacterium]
MPIERGRGPAEPKRRGPGNRIPAEHKVRPAANHTPGENNGGIRGDQSAGANKPRAARDQTPSQNKHRAARDQTPSQNKRRIARDRNVLRAVPQVAELPGGAHVWLGTTLDLTETAQQVLHLAVPRLGDAAAVYVREPLFAIGVPGGREAGDQVIARCLVSSLPHGGGLGDEEFSLGRDVIIFAAGTPLSRCLDDATPVLFEQAIASSRTSFLVMPMTAHGEVTGFLLIAREPGRPGYDADDMAAASELAARAGVCVDNARLFAQERRTAEALQRGLLPRDLPTPRGVEVAHRYVPAGDHLVGGDWCDLVPLPEDRTAIVVGDAMGHGPEAASVMAQLRAAAHVLADLDLPPDALLGRLNRMAATVADGTFATCVCATVDPARGTCMIARAGHLPPILALPDGSTQVIDLPPGLPLGLGEATFHAIQTTLPPGAILALYTDGLVESRKRPFDEGILALRTALAAAVGPLPTRCSSITESLGQCGEDDTTLVLVRAAADTQA